ncbi:hypothetical protein HN371_20110 [Candidatus Poribacteria bacterium]|jgi:hypothetical protein|nr:hypothetical protein [Candidatus Poribacteria bacterium]MBT5532458.1 hypothetical protein [Candidatus Poribacteria bacterium]MBT5710431.1 hypothetical protein [Candidatus Poribacteria bacterium]MBT7098893.1 hypothetical protein [Candidatus Poribacteria bacterium]MBT7804159.1 hypothetical protein [Candidatus Poribacteria bacterium]
MALAFGVDIAATSAVGYGAALVLMVAFAIGVSRSAAKRDGDADSAPTAD